MFTQDDPVKLAIEAKQTERDQLANEIAAIENELEIKRTRLFWIDTFIEKGNLLLGVEVKLPQTDQESDFDSGVDLQPIEKPQLQGAQEILREFGRPMKASEIAKIFHKKKWKLSKDNGGQIIRNLLKRNEDLFERLTDGSFVLR